MKIFKRILYIILSLVGLVCIAVIVLAFWPTEWRIKNKGITPEQALEMRNAYSAPHTSFVATDGETIFLRRWNSDSIDQAKKNIAVLHFHGFTAYSGAYDMAGVPISEGGYTMFGIDYRGHGLSGGNRGDSKTKDRWIADLAESIAHVKSLGFQQVVVMGHSLGVAAAMCAANAVPNEIAGLILLSGAYESRPGINKPLSVLTQAKLLSSMIIRPSYRAVEYYREGMTVTEDSLFNFRYTPRFVMMLDVKTLRLPSTLDIPVLVGAGDQDELFEVEKVRALYDLIPSTKKEFLVMRNTTHAKLPRESWEEVVKWLDKTYVN